MLFAVDFLRNGSDSWVVDLATLKFIFVSVTFSDLRIDGAGSMTLLIAPSLEASDTLGFNLGTNVGLEVKVFEKGL